MKLIVGLGNPGGKYGNSRHNVGFVVVEEVAKKMGVEFTGQDKFKSEVARGEGYLLVKPQTFMNASGEAVAKLAGFYKIKVEEIVLVHDDLDIKLGEFKFQNAVGPKVHNGVESVEESLGSKDFWRARVGIDGRGGERSVAGEEYVLANFLEEEKRIIEKVIGETADQIVAGLRQY